MRTMSWPNRLTVTRILLIGPFVVALLNLRDPYWGQTARHAAVTFFFLMAITDGLDGYLARRLHQETMAGKLLDPLADKLLMLSSVIFLAHEGTHVPGALLPAVVAVAAVGKDLIVVLGFFIIYFSTSKVFIKPSRPGKWCTAVQLGMIIAILLSPDLPQQLEILPRILWWLATALALLATVTYFQMGRRFIAHQESLASTVH
ncbi:MAG TPA: CDP-alcohol phosphatidyltransferase family protein [Aggregatilineaceae bacterium]|nr:CDP-alcohol phosphatidyltransferase family protein [Aggregatilineaceae bacterium]